MPFQKGKSGNPRGLPKGVDLPGRPTDRFKELCRRALESAQGLKRMENLAAGKEFPQLATNEGEVLMLPAPIREWRAAVEWLADRGYGKADQTVDMRTEDVTSRPSAEELQSTLASLKRLAEGIGLDKKE